MKKTLIALAVAAVAATSANAAVVYEQNGTKVQVNGSLRVALEAKDFGAKFSSSEKRKASRESFKETLGNDGSRIIFRGDHDLGNGLSALASTEVRLQDSKNSVLTQNWFVGFAQEGVGTLTFGRQAIATDSVNFGDYEYAYGAEGQIDGAQDGVIKFRSADYNGFSFAVNTSHQKGERDAGIALHYTTALDANTKLNLGAGYLDDKEDGYRVGGEVVSGPFAVGYTYGQDTNTEKGKTRKNFHLLGAKYAVSETNTVNVQYSRGGAQNTYTAGVDHKISQNVLAFVQYGYSDGNDKKDSNSIKAGLRVNF